MTCFDVSCTEINSFFYSDVKAIERNGSLNDQPHEDKICVERCLDTNVSDNRTDFIFRSSRTSALKMDTARCSETLVSTHHIKGSATQTTVVETSNVTL
jgi:hypothetical protein